MKAAAQITPQNTKLVVCRIHGLDVIVKQNMFSSFTSALHIGLDSDDRLFGPRFGPTKIEHMLHMNT